MSVTYELLEEFTGTRATEGPDIENEGQTITTTADVRDIQVKFTCGNTACTHERSVNVCYDVDGVYDAAATAVRVQEVADGVEHKIAVGVIQ